MLVRQAVLLTSRGPVRPTHFFSHTQVTPLASYWIETTCKPLFCNPFLFKSLQTPGVCPSPCPQSPSFRPIAAKLFWCHNDASIRKRLGTPPLPPVSNKSERTSGPATAPRCPRSQTPTWSGLGMQVVPGSTVLKVELSRPDNGRTWYRRVTRVSHPVVADAHQRRVGKAGSVRLG
jgi:hypothetical protein